MRRRPSLASVCSFIAVAGATLFVLWQMNPSLLLAHTTPSGGDMGAHVWGPAYLRDHLLHHGQLTGWTPDWYAGFPAFTFYFPLPSLLIVLLDVLLPYGVAFKLVTVLGVVALPVCAYVFARLIGLRGAAPATVAVLMVPFLFERSYTIYGGNIPSTLAGEFSFSISLACALLFLGFFARGLATGRHRGLAAVLLAVTGLCHLLPTLFAGVGAVILVLMHIDRRRVKWAIPIGIVAAMLGAFWWLPFLMRLPYATDMGWEPLRTYWSAFFPKSLHAPLALAAIGVAASVVLRRRAGLFLTFLAGASVLAFFAMPAGRLWNARMLPFWFISVYLLAGIGATVIGEGVAVAAGWLAKRPVSQDIDDAEIDTFGEPEPATPVPDEPSPVERSVRAVIPVVACAVFLVVVALPLHVLPKSFPVTTADSSFIPGWVRWNYEGYERKAAYPEYHDVIQTMTDVGTEHGCGRASWEYEPELDRYGTPMALMLLPYWTHGCIGSMEGLYFESAATTPYHFLSNSELSLRPPRPQRDLPYRDLNVTLGVQHLQLLGVRYYMALSDAAQAQARGNPDLTLVARTKPWTATVTESGQPAESKSRSWEVYEVAHSALVAPLTNTPAVMRGVPKGGEGWQKAAVDWWQADESHWSVPLAASGPKEWPRVDGAVATLPQQSVKPARVSHIRTKDNRISFDVDRVGSPVLVKMSYFPNWKASGARGPWRVTPNQMVVIPTSKHVTLRYAETPVDLTGWVLTYLGVIAVIVLSRRRVFDPMAHDEHAEEPEDYDSALARLAAELEPEAAEPVH
jgi:hypothetical protein